MGKQKSLAMNETTDLSPIAENMGYWDKTWQPSKDPSNATLGIAFSGWVDVDKAIMDSMKVKDHLVGDKYISIGGGNDSGYFNSTNLKAITTAIKEYKFAGYNGIAYDIEEGNSGLVFDFLDSFKVAKATGYKVLVTISHSAPYGFADAPTLMNAFFEDENIDFLSPQLYSLGDETKNDYQISQDVTWESYANCKAAVIPSVVKSSYYPSAEEFFTGKGVTLKGYVQWSQIG